MNTDFAEIKRTTDIVAVVESRGVLLKREGKDWRGRCPFHADEGRPNLIVTQDKGLFHCPACGAAGNVIQFVARLDQITEREAALKLLGAVPGVSVASALLPSAEPTPPVVVPAEVAAKLLARVAEYYAKALHKNRAVLDYLKSRGLDDAALLETFAVGYCDGSMRQTLPPGGEVVEQLQALGVLNDKGNEVFYRRVVVPIYSAAGEVVSLYGRRMGDEEPRHLYLRGERRGLFNGQAAKADKSLILVESIIDAMSLWAAGFHNAVALYGVDGWTESHSALVRDNAVSEIYLALDNDAAGKAGAERLTPRLKELGVAVYGVTWPEKDANDFFSSRAGAGRKGSREDFAALLKAANPGSAPSPAADPRLEKEAIELSADGFAATYGAGARRYELCGVERPSASRLKATVRAIAPATKEPRFVIDTLDFYVMRAKRSFIADAARLFKESVEVIESDVNRLTLAAEAFVAQRGALPTAGVAGNGADLAEGLRLGRSTDLLGEIRRDLEKLGVIGEHTNGLLLYLAITSRKMEDPMAVQILSSSGAGKSHLLDAVLTLCPEEDLVKLTSLSDCALFYKGEDSLRNKVLAVSEVAGAEGARYALRNLISEKKLVKESTVTNPVSGRLVTQVSTVYGPTTVLETTTNPYTDPETKSRYWLVSVDESMAQTLAILAAQRQSHTLDGRRRHAARAEVLARHHAYQRSLIALMVVNPFEPLLTYGDGRLGFRRDQPKYLNLILVVTFLHQHQRVVKHDPECGDYIESTLEDIAVANALVTELIGKNLDELSFPSRELLRLIGKYVEQRAQASGKQPQERMQPQEITQPQAVEWTRRELREAIGWTEARLRAHLEELVRFEYVVAIAGRFGSRFRYRLCIEPEQIAENGRVSVALKSVAELSEEARLAGLEVNLAGQNPNLAGGPANLAATSQASICEVYPAANPDGIRTNGHIATNLAGHSGKRTYVLRKDGVRKAASNPAEAAS